MIRNRKLTVRLMAVLLAFGLIAAACGDDDEGADTTTTTAAPTTTAAEETTTTAADGGEETTTTEAAEETTTTAADAEPVIVCELAYYTGEFAPYGPSLTNDVVWPIEYVINEDPPLGRTWEFIAEDLGTVGEAQAARTCLEQHDADIVVSQSHGYRTYRDYMIEYIEENDKPLGPTVHGGTIPGNLGGTADEPLFRAQGLDEALGMTGVLYAQTLNLESIVVFATQVEGFQIAADAAVKTAEAIGIEVLARIDVPAEQPTYRAEAQQIADLEPDAVIVQAGSVESATLIKQAAEAGLSLYWIGETGWIQQEFIGSLGTDPIPTQQGIGYAAFSYNDDSPAWEYYSQRWEETGQVEEFGPASDNYHYSTYDLMVLTALAVEYGGSYLASDWAPAMHEVGSAPGEICYTYADCLELIRAGEDIDYEGVTGNGTFTEGGVNHVVQAFFPFNDDGTVGEAIEIDPTLALETITEIAIEAECDANNVCTW